MHEFLFRYFWIAFIVSTVINAFMLRRRSREYIERDPQLEEGYRALFKGYLIYGNIPWVIMGIGILQGSVNSIFSYFHPAQLNPAVLTFHASIIVLWLLSVRWIYFKGGAELLERHPGLLKGNPSARRIKFFFPLILLAGVAGMAMMWFVPATLPQVPQ